MRGDKQKSGGRRFRLGVTAGFSAAHRLPQHEGKCRELHGHTYRVEVVFEGEQKEDGMVADFSQLKGVVRDALEALDHKYLNEVLENPTSENIAVFILEHVARLAERRGLGVEVVAVRVWEDEDKWVSFNPTLV
ncbi:MAG: 6-carboxytetrahydropterin synthase QueD [Candidatus Alkanophagales archaeon]